MKNIVCCSNIVLRFVFPLLIVRLFIETLVFLFLIKLERVHRRGLLEIFFFSLLKALYGLKSYQLVLYWKLYIPLITGFGLILLRIFVIEYKI